MKMFLDVSIDVNQLASQIGSVADKIAKVGGPIVAHGYKVFVEQQVIIGYEQIAAGILVVLFAIGAFIGARIVRCEWKKNESICPFDYKAEDYCGGMIVFICAGAVLLLVALFFFAAGLGHILDPEYGAIQDILGK